jgi:hypothetical protein
MSAQPDPHAELGVPPGATQAEIHQAFRSRLREHHPDTRPRGDTADAVSDQALQRVLAAYEALRHQGAPPPVEAHTDVQPNRADRPAPGGRSRSLGVPPLKATAVTWVPAAGTGPSRYPAHDLSSHGLPWPEWLIRWLLDQ